MSTKYMVPLNPLQQPVAAVDSRFCLPHKVSLLMREFLNSDNFTITDVNTGQAYFSLNQKFSLRGKEVLTDIYGNVVANSKGSFFSSGVKIFRGGHSDVLIGETFRNSAFGMFKINAQVRLLNGQLVTIVMKGENHYNCTMWIGEPKQGGTPIAFCYPNPNRGMFSSMQYIVDIAPGMDCALVILLLVIYEEVSEPKRS